MQIKHANDHYEGHFATENFWPHFPTSMYYTDGVKAVAKDTEGQWLIDLVFGLQKRLTLRQHPFQVWHLKRVIDDAFIIKATDGNENQIHIGFVPFISFPYDSCTLWLVDGTLMLPSEY